MKKLLIILFLLTTLSIFSQSRINVKKTFYGFDFWGTEIKIEIIEYKIYKGFHVDYKLRGIETFYLLTEKPKYNLTIKEPKQNYMWFAWKKIGGEMLIDPTPIYVISVYDEKADLITFVFNLDLGTSYINNYAIQFEKRNL
jgi:hypothetical protein